MPDQAFWGSGGSSSDGDGVVGSETAGGGAGNWALYFLRTANASLMRAADSAVVPDVVSPEVRPFDVRRTSSRPWTLEPTAAAIVNDAGQAKPPDRAALKFRLSNPPELPRLRRFGWITPREFRLQTRNSRSPFGLRLFVLVSCYLMIFVTRPAPTVRPPSRMAKRRPSSMGAPEQVLP